MSQSYKKLFRIASDHNYFVNGIPYNVSYLPTLETAHLLKRQRMIHRLRPGELTVYFQSIDGSNPTVSLGNERFTFLVRVVDVGEFTNYTILDTTETFTQGKKLHFLNDPVGTADIQHTLLDKIRREVFTYTSPVAAGNASHTLDMELKHLMSGQVIDIAGVHANDALEFVIPIDLSKARRGVYEFKSTNNDTAATETERIYVDSDVAGQSFFGVVDIDWEAGSLEDYKLKYARKSTFWNYILVNRSNRSDFDDLLIKDNGSASAPYAVNSFPKQGGALTIAGKPAVKFRSDVEIPFFETPKLDIELVKEVNGSDLVLYKNLSNPVVSQVGSSQTESDIYVFV